MKSNRPGRCGRLVPIVACLVLLGACGGGGGSPPAGGGAASADTGDTTVKSLAVPSQISVVTATE